MDLECARISGRVGIIDDRLVGHELSDDIGQFSWVREVDGVGRSIDDDEDDAVFYLSRDFVGCAPGPAVNGSRVPATTSVGMSKASSRSRRWILRERPEHPEGARNAEPQIVRDCDAQQPDRFPRDRRD